MSIGAARNVTLQHAAGKFLFSLDSDDVIFTEVLPELIRVLENNPETDIVCMNTMALLQNGQKNKISIVEEEGVVDALSNTIDDFGVEPGSALWFYAFRRDFIQKNKILCPITKGAEDQVFVMEAFYHAQKIYRFPRFFYLHDLTSEDSDSQHIFKIDDLLISMKSFLSLGGTRYSTAPSTAKAEMIMSLCLAFLIPMPGWCDVELLLSLVNPDSAGHFEALKLVENGAFPVLDTMSHTSLPAVFMNYLYEKLRRLSNDFQKKLYFCPCTISSLGWAKIISRLGGIVTGFADNNPSKDNYSVSLCLEAGYDTFPVASLEGRNDSSVLLIHHRRRVTQSLSSQIESLGLPQDACSDLFSIGRDFLCGAGSRFCEDEQHGTNS
jgi:glycosyltransferase involved in cell wall biosynthesis